MLEKSYWPEQNIFITEDILEIEHNDYLQVTPISENLQKLLSFQTFFGLAWGWKRYI